MKSDFTSIQERIRQWQTSRNQQTWLKPLKTQTQFSEYCIPFALSDYFEFVNWTGCAIRKDKRGVINPHLPAILHRLGIDADEWLKTMRPNGNRFVRGIGRKKALQVYAEKVRKRWLHGMGASQCLFA